MSNRRAVPRDVLSSPVIRSMRRGNRAGEEAVEKPPYFTGIVFESTSRSSGVGINQQVQADMVNLIGREGACSTSSPFVDF